jgi:hypothetical protein
MKDMVDRLICGKKLEMTFLLLRFDRIGIMILRLGRDKAGYGEGIDLFQ